MYENFKRSHLDTERLCNEDGFAFRPIVAEAVGGSWGHAGAKVFNELAKSKSMMTGEPVDHLLTQLYQNLGVILHRENARSKVKRMYAQPRTSSHILAAAATLQCNVTDDV